MREIIIVVVIGLGVMFTRFMPFVLLKEKEIPEKYQHILNAIPYATISLLVVYALKDVNKTSIFPTIIASSLCIVTYSYKRNTIFSIIVSTITYMVLIQTF